MKFKCPYCGNSQSVDPGYLDWFDGDIKDIICKKCEKTYELLGHETTSYTVAEKTNG